ncbi:hypothetical protein KGF56_000022 [Candida oxycetoniae]|uniref:Uncharacterized protein n=1 Tax=Candida oxycetoniae TaxID=497107 RepID=A0AAI9X058_9ASCO|nr:uncharacterized protein KGF56_000022 [Candida oxycetoniae]KAI3407121.2 hypothetical protein KGF56_000022 [Candida oxycetoniae]
MADKIREKHQYAFLKSKYEGIGNSNTSNDEFQTTVYNDTIASLAHHKHILLYNSIILNQHPEILRQDMIRRIKLDVHNAEK